MTVGYIALARVQQAQGDLEEASRTLAKAEEITAGRTITPDQAGELRTLRIFLDLLRGDLASAQAWAAHAWAAHAWASQLPLDRLPDFLHESDFTLLARVWIAQGNYQEAQDLLETLARQAEAGKRVTRQIKIALLWAEALRAQGQVPEALEQLETCLRLGEPAGFVRAFLDEGEPIRELLSLYLKSPARGRQAYAKRLAEAFSLSASASPRPAPAELVEPLTERELEVLRLICLGRSNQEIAGKLVISLNTVKRHNNSLFGKLGVANRGQAIIRARQLGLA
jgi:LuxR family maltose regulon positive regulatory protein